MKQSFLSFLFLFVLSAFFTNEVFAELDPIPGVDILAKKKPGGIVAGTGHTDNEGKFSLDLEAGNYELTVSYSQIQKVLRSDKSYKSGDEITLSLDGGKTRGVMINDNKSPAKITIDKSTGVITLTIPKGGATISGTLIIFHDDAGAETGRMNKK